MSLSDRFGSTQLTESESKTLLREYDIPTVRDILAETVTEAREAAEEIGLPVILKIESRDIQHKTDVGGVAAADSLDEVEEAFEEIMAAVQEHRPDATIDGIMVEEKMDGNEFIVGVNDDPQFGKVLMFGLGGIYVEVFRDVGFRIIPVDDYDIDTLIDGLDAKKLLNGVRGQPAADMEKLRGFLKKVSGMVEAEPEIDELDINPLFVHGDEIKAADALITLGDTE